MRALAAELQLPSFSDSTGLLASIACAIHCAAMPFIAGYLPVLGLTWLADSSFHRVMALICFGLAVLAFLPGWRKHRSLLPAAIGSMGVALLGVAAFGLEGACCPTCVAAAEGATPPTSSAVASVCPDEDCELCAAEDSTATKLTSESSACTDENCEFCAAETIDATLISKKSPEATAPVAEATCTDENCELCAAEASTATPTSSELNPLVAWAIPLMTPLGGVLLIAGHLTNHRKLCNCPTCECGQEEAHC